MKKSMFLVLVILSYSINLSAQNNSWYKTFGQNYYYSGLWDVSKINNNSFQICGSSNSWNSTIGNGYFLNVDSNGKIIQDLYYQDSLNKGLIFTSIVNINNKLYTTGHLSFNNWDNFDVKLYCFDSTYNLIWGKQNYILNQDEYPIQVVFKNSYLYVLASYREEIKYEHCAIIKFDTLGNKIAEKEFLDSNFAYTRTYNLQVSNDSLISIIGWRKHLGTSKPINWFLKLDKNLNVIYSNDYLPNYCFFSENMLFINDTTFFASGYAPNSNSNFGYSCLYKINIADSTPICSIINIDTNFHYTSKLFPSEYDTLLITVTGNNILKYDYNGNIIWKSNIDNSLFINCNKIFQLRDKGYLLFGSAYTDSNTCKIMVIKIDSLGQFQLATTINPVNKTTESISIYPNPTNAIINIQALHPEEIKTIQLYNINGSLINAYPSTSKTIDISDYANGNYYLKIQYQNSFETKKIIKL